MSRSRPAGRPSMVWWQLAVRWVLSGGLVVGASEVARRSELFGALLVSIPLVSILAMIWLHNDTRDTEKVADFAEGVLWLVIPSLVLFIALPTLLRRGTEFWPAMGVAVGLTVVAYLIGLWIANKVGNVA